MSRSFLTIIALCAILSAAACNSVTGPVNDDNGDTGGTTGSGGRERNPVGQIASPDEVVPDDGDHGGGGEGTKEPIYVAPAPRQQPTEYEPIDN